MFDFVHPVASLGWVIPGAVTEGLTPLFFLRNLSTVLIAVTITIAFYCFHSGVTPLEGVTPHLFYLSYLVSPLFFVNLPTKSSKSSSFFSFACHPLEGVTRGGPPLPPSDATVLIISDLTSPVIVSLIYCFFCW